MYPIEVTVTMEKIDFELLRKQKEILVAVSSSKVLGSIMNESIDGIIHFLDQFQDQAAEILGEPIVYGKDGSNG